MEFEVIKVGVIATVLIVGATSMIPIGRVARLQVQRPGRPPAGPPLIPAPRRARRAPPRPRRAAPRLIRASTRSPERARPRRDSAAGLTRTPRSSPPSMPASAESPPAAEAPLASAPWSPRPCRSRPASPRASSASRPRPQAASAATASRDIRRCEPTNGLRNAIRLRSASTSCASRMRVSGAIDCGPRPSPPALPLSPAIHAPGEPAGRGRRSTTTMP